MLSIAHIARRRRFMGGFDLSRALFGAGQSGAMYDVSQADTRYQSINAELNAADADADPVGVLLDISQWGGKTFAQVMAAQAQKVTNGGFDADASWTKGAGWTIGSGVATASASSAALEQNVTVVANYTYLVSVDITRSAGNVTVGIGGVSATAISASGSYEFIFKATGTGNLQFTGSSFTGTIDNVSCKLIPGNHLTQSTAASRPTYKTALGLHWIEGDGTADFLNGVFSVPHPYDIIAAFRLNSWTNGASLVHGGSNDTSRLLMTALSPRLYMYSNAIGPYKSPTVGTDAVVRASYNGASSEISLNGDAAATGTVDIANSTGVTLFASYAGSGFANGRIYRLIMREAFSASERALAEAWATEAIT